MAKSRASAEYKANRPTTLVGRSQRWRDKIKASQLITRLQQHAMGEVDMTQSQINAAKILINKVYPDLKSVEMTVSEDRAAHELSYDELAERIRGRVSKASRSTN